MTRKALAAAAETPRARRVRARKIDRVLADVYPDAGCALRHRDAWQLLVATILSAQCTDARVNQVTPALFARYPTPRALADADPRELEAMIHSTGFFRQKTKSLLGVAAATVERFGGTLPRDLDTLVTLPGIGRKTANVVLGTAYGVPSVVVDTHVRRVAYRLGLTSEDDPAKIERDLQALLPAASWTDFTHRLVHHGRRVCHARKPRCGECPLLRLCPRIGVTDAVKSPT
ncbi:MAG: endonuclease III [Polyangiaceae bacterium UTPRO1]|jgi:endonuclease-3|nr:endonuclease III [Myxococcales bacterium]OQY67929.1 MAG: endonuclease III [Polyangiaceae bacterium UTPRO1]